ncbi:MAG: SPFH domain-containing protein, partial [Phycisphaerales bacterium]
VALLIVALLSYMVLYTVRFTEAAVETRFGQAGPDAVKLEPGLYFKLPYPIDDVTRYDVRTRFLTIKLEQLSTADNRQIIAEAFCTWKVKDPLRFFQRFSYTGDRAEDHYRAAEESLRKNMRAVLALVSKYRFNQLFASGGTDAISALEGEMLKQFAEAADKGGLSLKDYGIEAVDVGITRLMLPEETTKAVIDRMKAGRERLALETQSQGEAFAKSIRARAEADAKRITAFVDRLAQDIRTRGDLEAAPYLAMMNESPELAVYLDNIDFIRTVVAKRTTLVLPTTMPGMSLLDPSALDGLKSGQIPEFKTPKSWVTSMGKPAGDAQNGSQAR